MIRRRLLLASIPFLIAATYLTWCVHRFSAATFVHDKLFPRAWPYPDQFLLALNNYYDKMYPASDGYFKLHGEVARVQATFSAPAIILIAIYIALASPEVYRMLRRFVGHHGLLGKRLTSGVGGEQELTDLMQIRFRLRTLLILSAVAPCILAWFSRTGIECVAVFGLVILPPLLVICTGLLFLTLLLQRLRY